MGEGYTLATAVYAYMVLTPEVCLKRVILFLVYCHFLLLLQKKVTKEKEAGKENRFLQLSIINEQLTIFILFLLPELTYREAGCKTPTGQFTFLLPAPLY